MGAAVSHFGLARTVSTLGQLGVVSGTALDQGLVRRLQDGDPDGAVRRALEAFPFRGMADRILRNYFLPGGRKPGQQFAIAPLHTYDGDKRVAQELCIAGNFVEVYLAREGHGNPVGINYLEKIQLPHLPSLYGAMLAGVSVVIIGAGLPLHIPGALDALAVHQPATYPLNVAGSSAPEMVTMNFDPRAFHESGSPLAALVRPAFLPVVSSAVLAAVLIRRSNGKVDGFVVEGPTSGGHNAPPRGVLKLTEDGQPIYGSRDVVDLAVMSGLGLPFWLAGGYGSREGLQNALSHGAAGIQVGTAFALCVESGLLPSIRRALVLKALNGQARVRTDPVASPTGFPFKVAGLEGSLSEKEVYDKRRRICDLGFLREAWRRPDGSIGYRCAAEPEAAFVAKGGTLPETVGRVCLCNSLAANVGLAQRLRDGTEEPPMVTLGDDLKGIGRFCTKAKPDYTAADVVRVLLGK